MRPGARRSGAQCIWGAPITPEEYDRAEREALSQLPNRIIEASGTAHFNAVGYPTRIRSLSELWRYVEGMHDGDLRGAYALLGGLTEREFELVGRITQDVGNLVQKLCGRVVVPGPSLLRAVLVYREIMQQVPHGGRVFEVGPGSGYVGALVAREVQLTYSWTDVSQAFFLWQRHLFKDCGINVSVGIPWWEWMTDMAHLECDVFTCNHAIGEMHPNAFSYMIETAKKMLVPGGQFLIEEWGRHTYRTPDQARAEMARRGLSWGEIIATKPGDPPHNRTKTWDDLVAMWENYGGIPKSEDEKFLESIGGVW